MRPGAPHGSGVTFATLFYVLVPVAAVLVVVLGFAEFADVPVASLFRDSNAVLGGPFYVGSFSAIGVALWAAAGAMCILVLSTGMSGAAGKLLIAGAVVSITLGADDALLLHEAAESKLGIPELVFFSLHAIVVIVLFWPVRRYLASRPNIGVLVGSIGLLGVSLVVDQGVSQSFPHQPIIEDVAKFLGIVLWVAFFGGFCHAILRTVESASSTASEA
jgi:hypothetical protein